MAVQLELWQHCIQQDEVTKLNFMTSEMVSLVQWMLGQFTFDASIDPNFGDPSARPAIALIPLALSERGIRAIESAGVPGLIEDVLDDSMPLDARMVHSADEDGNLIQISIPYGPNGEVSGSNFQDCSRDPA